MSKELKSIDKKALTALNKYMNSKDKQPDNHIYYIVDNLAKFMTAKSGATYGAAKECFDTVENLHEKVRAVKVGGLNYKEIEKVIIEIQGKEGQSALLTKMTDNVK